MRIRTQIYLDRDQHGLAKRKAADRGLSLAEYIRRLVDRDLGRGARKRRDWRSLAALGDSGGSDVAASKDEYLGEAVESRRARTARRSSAGGS